MKVKHYEVSNGDTLYSLLKKHKFSEKQVRTILSQNTLPKKYTLIPGEKYRISKNSNTNGVFLMLFDRHDDIVYSFWRNGKKESGSQSYEETYDIKYVTASGKINGSIIGSIQKVIPDQWIAYRFLDAYVLDYNLRKILKRGAKFSITYEKKYDGDHFIKTGEVTRTSIEINNKEIVRIFVSTPEGGSFIDVNKKQKERPLYAPVAYLHFSSYFQPRRLHPIKKRRQPHLGVDFALPEGEKVFTASPGRVLRTGRNRASGKYIVIQHENGFQTFYNHLSTINKKIKPGVFVNNGLVIGAIGCTGYCTKPHLHFAVKRKGHYVNPIKYLKSFPYNNRIAVQRRLALIKKSN